MNAFQEASVDLCVCLGDFVDKGTTAEEPFVCVSEAIDLIRSYQIPYRVIPGNHDYTVFSADEFTERTGSPIPPYVWETDTHLLIFLDASYRSDERRFDVAGVEWKDSNLPQWQLDFLTETVARTDKNCVVLLHECISTDVNLDHRVKNADAIRAVLEESRRVSLVLQGHYHKGSEQSENGIRYLTLPAMCEGEGNSFLILDL